VVFIAWAIYYFLPNLRLKTREVLGAAGRSVRRSTTAAPTPAPPAA
jgi:hypothetical protein